MSLSYSDKFEVMSILFKPYKVESGYTSVYKNIPLDVYEKYKQFFDYTRFRVMFRGKLNYKELKLLNGGIYRQYDASVRKVNAKRVDVYQLTDNQIALNRALREEYLNNA